MKAIDPNILQKFEQISGMKSGYVFDFVNDDFSYFIYNVVGKKIYDSVYEGFGNSKAKRLRAFWSLESTDTVVKLLLAFIEYWKLNCDHSSSNGLKFDNNIYYYLKQELTKFCIHIADFSNFSYEEISDEATMCLEHAKNFIEKGQPEGAVDRVHTFAMNFVRKCLLDTGSSYLKNESLDALYGKLKKIIFSKDIILPEFSKMFLSSSTCISTLNDIRNKKSLAHDNKIVTSEEAMYLIDNVMSLLKYVSTLLNT